MSQLQNLDKGLSEKLIGYFDMMSDKTIVISTHDDFLINSGIGSGSFELKRSRYAFDVAIYHNIFSC